MTTEIVSYSATEAAIAGLTAKYAKEAEQADSKAMLLLFKQRFGHLPQYAGVIKAINEALK